jgi:hypothetical protein
LPYPIFAARFLKKQSSSPNKLIFTPNNSNKIEKKFGRNIQALTFALPLKKGNGGKAKRSLKVGKQ